MAAPTISHLICTMALVMLIFIMPFFYAIVVDNIRVDMVQKELKEISDYVSNTLANLYFLANSTDVPSVSMQKDLIYLPFTVEDSIYILKIEGTGKNASKITAYLKDKPSVAADAWLPPGLYRDEGRSVIESGARTFAACCIRNVTGVYVWITAV